MTYNVSSGTLSLYTTTTSGRPQVAAGLVPGKQLVGKRSYLQQSSYWLGRLSQKWPIMCRARH